MLSQTPALMVVAAKAANLNPPAGQEDQALVATLNVADLWSEGYTDRKKADKGASFLVSIYQRTTTEGLAENNTPRNKVSVL